MSNDAGHWHSEDEDDDLPPLEAITLYLGGHRGPNLVATRARPPHAGRTASSASRSRSPPGLVATTPDNEFEGPPLEPITTYTRDRPRSVFLLRESSNDQVSSIATTEDRERLDELAEDDGPPGLEYVSDDTDDDFLPAIRHHPTTLRRTRSTDDIPGLGGGQEEASDEEPLAELDPTAANRLADEPGIQRPGESTNLGNFLLSPGLGTLGARNETREARAETLLKAMIVLDEDTLKRYHRVCVANADNDEDRERGAGCSICWETLRMAEDLKPIALPCTHVFHDGCLKSWFIRGSTCPECRFDLDPERVLTGGPTFLQYDSLSQMFDALSIQRPEPSGARVNHVVLSQAWYTPASAVGPPPPRDPDADPDAVPDLIDAQSEEIVEAPPEDSIRHARLRQAMSNLRSMRLGMELSNVRQEDIPPPFNFPNNPPDYPSGPPAPVPYVAPKGAQTFEEMLAAKEKALGLE